MAIHRAGMIPYFIDSNQEVWMYFMKPSHPDFGGDKFQIAKGRIDEGFNELETAYKEAKEELGLKAENISGQPIHVGVFMKGISIFAIEVKDMNNFDEPHFETGETRWMNLNEFKEEGRELHLNSVLNAHRKISKSLKINK